MEKVLVVMCFWKRVNNLPEILKRLESQTYKNFKFVIWDNSDEHDKMQKMLSGSSIDYELIKSEKNIGGIGRFHAAKKYANDFKIVIFFDDDQFPEKNFIEVMVKNFEKKSIKSRHCYKIASPTDYWKRNRITAGRTNINYCGTCGMVLDNSIFLQDGILDCPEEYKFIEDLWLSFYAQHKLKWKLQAIDVPLGLVDDGKDQYKALIQKKSDFLKYLTAKEKWDIQKTY